jgi:peptidyl-prolyl cis-trans isomerase B (cyclophilin B)
MSTPDRPQQPASSPQYGQQAPYPPSNQPGYNTMSIVAFILAFFISVVGVILGFVALSQIKRTGEQGHGLALAAIIIGFAEILLGIILTIFFIAIAIGAANSGVYQTN